MKSKNVKLESYLLTDITKYDNKLSDVANSLSNSISKLVKGSVENVFKLLVNLVDN